MFGRFGMRRNLKLTKQIGRVVKQIAVGYITLAFLSYGAMAAIEMDLPEGWAAENGGTTGGIGGEKVTVTNLSELNDALSGDAKRIVFMKGEIKGTVKLGSNKSLIGYPGSSIFGTLEGDKIKNIIIRNIKVHNEECGGSYTDCKSGPDAMHFTGMENVWVDHCDISNGQDGNLDMTKICDYFTITYCKFYYTYANPHNRSNLFGSSDGRTSDEGHYKTTFQYNWWTEGVGTRMPRTRYGDVHIVNNLYDSDVSDYCITVGKKARCLIVGNAFYGVKDPVKDGGGTGEARDNLFSGTQGNTTTSGGAFTPPYTLQIIPAEQVQAKVKSQAGQTLTIDGNSSVGLNFKRIPNPDFTGKALILNEHWAVEWNSSFYDLNGKTALPNKNFLEHRSN